VNRRSLGHIVWTVDGQTYHEATPDDVAPKRWVYDHAFYLLVNLAVGGGLGGPVRADTAFPARYLIDYVRVYQAAD
jgi:beta-glucanase (GH16 family)